VPAERCEVLKKERGDAEARARMPARPSRRFGWRQILAAAIKAVSGMVDNRVPHSCFCWPDG
jgi:hypothetical protein